MKKYKILYIGGLPELIKKELYSRLPTGFELDFLDRESPTTKKHRALKETDFIMGFAKPMSKGQFGNFTIEEDQMEQLRDHCKKTGLKMSTVVRNGLKLYFIREAKKEAQRKD